jgi:hypothetical protein
MLQATCCQLLLWCKAAFQGVRSVYHRLGNIRRGDRILSRLSINKESFRRYCKNKFFELTKIFFFNVKETELRAVVDSVIIIFKILNQDAMCIMGCGKKKFRNTPLVNNPVVHFLML